MASMPLFHNARQDPLADDARVSRSAPRSPQTDPLGSGASGKRRLVDVGDGATRTALFRSVSRTAGNAAAAQLARTRSPEVQREPPGAAAGAAVGGGIDTAVGGGVGTAIAAA